MAREILVNCKSVFKGGSIRTTKAQYTGKWIELINQQEKNKKGTLNTKMKG